MKAELGNTPADKDYKPSGISRAEEAALKRFPEEMTRIPYQDLIEAFGGKEYVDFNSMPRGYFQLGYEQAEKDLALTWEDMAMINTFGSEVIGEHLFDNWTEQQIYTEVLTRFKQIKEVKK